jgi:hypothetical protein
MYITDKGPNAENPKARNYYFEYWQVGSRHLKSGTMTEENPAIEHLVMRVLFLTRPMEKENHVED